MNNIWKRSARKTRKAAEKRRTKVPRNRTHASRPNHPRPAQLAGQPGGTAWSCHVARPCHVARCGRAMWHSRATCAMLGYFFWQIFGTVTPCLWARPCHPRSASRLKSSLGAVLRGFSFPFIFTLVLRLVSLSILPRQFLGLTLV